MNSFLIAWRNLWRNRRRTLITVASVLFAVFFALVMRSLQLGTYSHMFRNVIESYTGYIQIQHEDFWDSKTIDNLFGYTPELEQKIMDDANAVATVPRLESFALASSGTLTKGVLVMGIDPEKEAFLSNVRSRIVSYRLDDNSIQKLMSSELPGKYKEKLGQFRGKSYSSRPAVMLDLGITDEDSSVMQIIAKHASFSSGYISSGEHGVLVGNRLASYLKISVGDTLVLLGQGYHGTTAAGKFRVNGIVILPTPDLDNKIVYLPVDISQELYNAPGMLTSLAVSIKDHDDSEVDRMISDLGSKIESPLRVIGWREMNDLLVNQLEADSRSGMIMIAILYMVIAFGIFGTVLMMTAERRREFGVLVAVGMQKTKLAGVVATEMLYIGIMGVLSGAAVALPAILYGYHNPIRFSGEMARMYEDYGMEPVMPMLLPGMYFVWQSVVVTLLVLIAISYPVRKIMKMKVVNSLKA